MVRMRSELQSESLNRPKTIKTQVLKLIFLFFIDFWIVRNWKKILKIKGEKKWVLDWSKILCFFHQKFPKDKTFRFFQKFIFVQIGRKWTVWFFKSSKNEQISDFKKDFIDFLIVRNWKKFLKIKVEKTFFFFLVENPLFFSPKIPQRQKFSIFSKIYFLFK